jgi:hypothetical protein
MNRRYPFEWLKRVYVLETPLDEDEKDTSIPFTRVYRKPIEGVEYVISADPAEGNPTSDDSVAHVLSIETGEECCVLAGKVEPGTLALYLSQLSIWYNNARILPERNNHGHAVILSLDETYDIQCLRGQDGRFGWNTSGKSKAQACTSTAEACRDREVIIHDPDTFLQLASIEGATLKAPEGSPDDYASSFSIGICAIKFGEPSAEYGTSPTQDYRG